MTMAAMWTWPSACAKAVSGKALSKRARMGYRLTDITRIA